MYKKKLADEQSALSNLIHFYNSQPGARKKQFRRYAKTTLKHVIPDDLYHKLLKHITLNK